MADLDPRPAPVAGLAFRGFDGPEDYGLIAELINARSAADGRPERATPRSVERSLAEGEGFSKRDCLALAAAEDGSLAAYARFFRRNEGEGRRVFLIALNVLPRWRVGDAAGSLLSWAEASIEREAEADRRSGRLGADERARCHCPAHSSDPSKIALLESRGYRVVRVFATMSMPAGRAALAGEPPLPPGLELRPLEEGDYRRAWEAEDEAFAEHWGHAEPSEEDYAKWLADDREFAPGLWKVAWDAATGEIAGSAWCHIAAEEAPPGRRILEIDSLAVRRPWRRRGLGRALLARALSQVAPLGLEGARLVVDTENPGEALALYRSLGFEVEASSPIYRKDLDAE